MGSYQAKNRDEFTEIVEAISQEKNRRPVFSVQAKPDQRYRNLMVFALKKSQLNELYKINLENCICLKMSRQEISSALLILNNLKLNDIPIPIQFRILQQSSSSQKTSNVSINFQQLKNKRKNMMAKNQIPELTYLEDTLEGRNKTVSDFLIHQITKPVHPFYRLCLKFSDLLHLDETLLRVCAEESEYRNWEKMVRGLLRQFCVFLVRGCLQIYRRWLITYMGISQKKYQKWIVSLVMNQIWSIGNHHLYHQMIKIINFSKIPLQVPLQNLINGFSIGFVKPELFNIDKQLQIQGHYFSAVYDLSEIPNFSQPSLILRQLQQIKGSICVDIDNYHKLSQKNQVYEINGDNIMGIIAYLLSKVTPKINDIHTQMLFLGIVFGQYIFYSMDASSYIFATIMGALQFLESQQFQQTLKTGIQINFGQNAKKNKKQTISESKETSESLVDKKALIRDL